MSNDQAYANREFIPDGDAYPPRWQAEAEAFRAAIGARGRVNLRYGTGRRQVWDLFEPAGEASGTLIFVHGGYWKSFDKDYWSAFSGGALERGWAVAMPSYTLAPEAAIPAITGEMVMALRTVARACPGPLALAGHSAGGHLVARLLCADVALEDAIAERIVSCVPISPVADLRPLIDTAMNETLRLDTATAEAESPALQVPARRPAMAVWVGAQERPAFLEQAGWLSEAWDVPRRIAPERHHFDVIEALKDPASPMMADILPS